MDEYTQKWIGLAIRDHLNSEERMPTAYACGICGDRATGKHYGALSCDGCKGFFRRSVRNNNVYNCRFSRRCLVDKDKRNQCRYCRLRKCFKVGMKVAAVQNERDTIRKHRGSTQEELVPRPSLSVNFLRQAEIQAEELRENSYRPNTDSGTNKKRATVYDLFETMKSHLVSLVAWAKSVPVFCELLKRDRIVLLRNAVVPHLIWIVVRRSLHMENVLVLSNDRLLGAEETEKNKKNAQTTTVDPLNDVARRISKELVLPLSRLEMDAVEFACLKAIIFFDPDVNVTMSDFVRAARTQIQTNLQDHVSDQQYDFRGRFGDLILTLSNVKSITAQIYELLETSGLFEEVSLDEVLFAALDNLIDDDTIVIKSSSTLEEPQVNGKGKRRRRQGVVGNGDSDSSATVSSPNSPGDETMDPFENVRIKVETDDYES